METKKKPRKNDPERVSRAWLRFGAALVCAFILLAVTSFGFVRLMRGGTPILKLDRLVPGDYVQQDVSIVLDNIATGYRGEKATEVYDMLAKHFMVDYDETGSIGKRYRRQDEIGTPMCVTVDFDTLETGVVTVRDRDTMEQDHVALDNLVQYLTKKIEY